MYTILFTFNQHHYFWRRDSLESSISEVKNTNICASPWNLSGRSVIFVKIRWDTRFQLFRPSDANENTLLDQQMAYQNLVCFSSVFILMRLLKVKICSHPGGPPPLKCGIIYLHSSSMASQRMNERFDKNLDPFIDLRHAWGHNPTSVLLGQQRCIKRLWNWRNIFKRLQVLRYTWSHIRFGLMGVMIESRRAMQLTWLWCIQYA